MVRPENVESKIAALRSYLKLIQRYRNKSISQLTSDIDVKGAVERYLFLACQSAIDLAEMLCKLKGLGKPDSMARAFELLHVAQVIDEPLFQKLVKMVGFRNALSHGYENLNYQIVMQVLQVGIKDLESFAREAENFIL